MKECGFKACRADPCILYKLVDGVLKIVMSIHVDDSLCAGRKSDLDELYAKVREKYKITTLGVIKNYLGVNYEWEKDEQGSPNVITSMAKNAHDIVQYYEKVTQTSTKTATTAGFPGVALDKNFG